MAATMQQKKTGASSGGLKSQLLNQYGGKDESALPQTLMLDHVSPATRLLEKRRQMFEVQEALNAQKDEFNRRENAFRRREDSLRRKDLELQESLIKFNKFLLENEAKRNRALKRAAEEKKQRDQKDVEIKRLEQQLKSKLQEGAILKTELEKNIKYQEYLENVVGSMSKFFPEISDVLNRYKTLKDANAYLLEKQMTDEGQSDLTLRDFITYRKVKENQVLNDNNEIAEMQIKLENNKAKTLRVQGDIDQVTEAVSAKALDLGQILSSVSNILDRCETNFRIRHNKPMIDNSDKTLGMPLFEKCMITKGKLDEIAMFMVDLKSIREEYNHDVKKNKEDAGKDANVDLHGKSVVSDTTGVL